MTLDLTFSKYIIVLPIIIPIVVGLTLLLMKESRNKCIPVGVTILGLLSTICSIVVILIRGGGSLTIFYLAKNLPIYFHIDDVGKLFVVLVTVIWVLVGIYSFAYMEHLRKNNRYYGFYLLVYGILVGLDFSGNLITLYLFYELMTFMSVPLVLHEQTKEAVHAALKYVFYSLGGAYMVLFGLYFVMQYSDSIVFASGGVINSELLQGKESFMLVIAFIMILGFSVKAGMYPFHAWLSTAHPVAPSPASALLSGVIVKSGVLGMIRVVYYVFGVDNIKGTWVQTAWISLAMVTVLMGSVMAYREKIIKKRLAYSTVSQISYIIIGIALCNPIGVSGALLHVVAHAIIKCCLFLCAGIIILRTNKHKVEEIGGIGKIMPITLWCYTFASFALIGIPPTSGFISKWYIAIGALNSGIRVVSWMVPVVLLVSAILTAGYLLPISINGFLGKGYDDYVEYKKEADIKMLIPIIVLALLAVVLGLYPNHMIGCVNKISMSLLGIIG